MKGYVAAVLGLCVALAGAWTLVTRLDGPREVPPGTVALIAGEAVHARDLLRGDRFENAFEARRQLEAFIDAVLLRRAMQEQAIPADEPDPMGVLMARRGLPRPVTAEEVERFYAEHEDRYVMAHSVRFAYFRVPHSGDAQRDDSRIRSLYVQAQLAARHAALQQLIGRRSPGSERGSVGPVPCAGASPELLPLQVLERACGMRTGSLTSPFVLDDAHYVVRKLAEYPAIHRRLGEVRHRIRRELEFDRLVEARALIRDELREAAEVEIFEEALMWLHEPETPFTGEVDGPPSIPGAEA